MLKIIDRNYVITLDERFKKIHNNTGLQILLFSLLLNAHQFFMVSAADNSYYVH